MTYGHGKYSRAVALGYALLLLGAVLSCRAGPSPVERDTEFNGGSRIKDQVLSDVQVQNLALLARVWGFLKYHHPKVTAGQRNWDYELFRVMPKVLAAANRAVGIGAITEWVEAVGAPKRCTACAMVPTAIHVPPPVDWIRDAVGLGHALSARLVSVYENRNGARKQYYVSHDPEVGNPNFSNENAYADQPLPDAGFRLLALYRWWNIIEYWFPYRDVLDADWDDVLPEFIPRLMTVADANTYRLTMIEVIARVDDTHANLWTSLAVQPPVGTARLPVVVRFIEGEAVVTGFSNPALGQATGLEVGDVIEAIGGARVDSLVSALRPYYAASNEPTRLRDIAVKLTKGPAGPVTVSVRRGTHRFQWVSARAPRDQLDAEIGRAHDRPGDPFQMLTDEVAYLKLSSVVGADAADYVRRASRAKVFVIDIRNYPSEFVVFRLGEHLVRERTDIARSTRGDAANPGAFVWTKPIVLKPKEPHYAGHVVILIDEITQSSAEYTAMAFRAAPHATVVGSTTAGADGNVSPIHLPGGIRGLISGVGVFYADRSPTQRIGIIPDQVVLPTIAGIRAGRDEVLEAAVSGALGQAWRVPVGR